MTKTLKLAKELALPPDVVTQKINVLGQSGGGKTYLAMKLAELMLEQLAQIVVVDLVGVWWGLLSSADGLRAGFPILVIGGEHGQLPITAGSGALVADMVVDRGVSVVLDVSGLLTEDAVLFVTAFIDRLFHRKKTAKSPLHLFLEEAQELAPESPSSKGEVKLKAVLTRLCKIGRNYGIGYTVITQEPQAASKRVLNQAGTIIAVRTIGKHERDAIAGTARSRATSQGMLDLVNVLPELATSEAIVWSPAWLKFAGRVHILPKVTFDSSKTPEVGERPREPKVLAPVEIEKYAAAMKAVVAEAEARDPTALQRRVRQLEAELAARPPPALPERIEVPAMSDEDRGQLKKLGEALFAATHALVELDKRLGTIPGAQLRPMPRTAPPARTGGWSVAKPAPVRHQAASAPAYSDAKLAKGERAVLTAIAQHRDGVTREQLSVLTGYKRSSRDTYLQKLMASTLVAQAGEVVGVTAAGLEALGSDFEPLPTGEALRQHWLARLPGGERRIFEILIDAYPNAVEREAIGDRTGYKRSSRDTYLQKLSARRLIVATSRGPIVASETLFA